MAGFYTTCVIDGVLEHSPAEYLRRLRVSAESPTLGLNHLQFEATGSDIDGLDEVHGHRLVRGRGKGDKMALAPLPPAVGRAIGRALEDRLGGPILRSRTSSRMDRHCATRHLRTLAKAAGLATARMHPHMLRQRALADARSCYAADADVRSAEPASVGFSASCGFGQRAIRREGCRGSRGT